MRHLLLPILSLLLLTPSCSRKPPKAVVPPLPSVKLEDVPAPASVTVTIPRGSNLRQVATTAYGYEDFSGFVAALNGLADPERVAAGAVLKTPSLPAALRDAGLDPAYQPAFNVLAQTWAELRTALPDYQRERDAAGARDGTTFAITVARSRRLIQCADYMDAALDVLAHPKEGHKLPRSTLGQLAGASGYLRLFATGQVGSMDYDVFLAEKSFGLGFTYALIWVKAHHQ
ncbi:MAG: hypothetical protein NTY98_12955 [Verrucomicrobia bacterium]|nr:hypothetical protein [Verrucomicrobiota bacterium]